MQTRDFGQKQFSCTIDFISKSEKTVRLRLLPVLSFVFASIWCGAASAGSSGERKFYYPNAEPLGEAEMRVISLGTGTPNFRHSQASASWLVELGNGDKFLFDVGTGSLANLAALEIPYTYLDKVFISHLHVDHIGDLDALFVGGWVSNRTVPLQVWGPSGLKPEYGTAAAMDGLLKMLGWDLAGRRGNMPSAGGHLSVTEFDYSKTQIVYESDGVVIRSWPAIHGIDGSVSYSLEWKGLKFVYSGDTNPNKWFVENAKEADLVIHECYLTIQQFIDIKNYDPERARLVATVVHTPPDACGKLFAMIEPRHAIAYHTFADFDIAPDTIAAIRKTYDGPLTLAQDMLVWNVSEDAVSVREIVGSDSPLPVDPPTPAGPPDPSERTELSDWLNAGRLNLNGD
ncbi:MULTISPECIES: guanitoxin biosynthesis MBL fold metallo-hydrolase GntH [unclassified Ruegeria]|uniref:guanitoxin biosynthesis MBL fold metallo-hydrolase GntH n=1 Tax=unclassified Ruegeria TaxID=2625375 RepID=UPI001488D1B7|nr:MULTISPECIES: guanitoxin biosynthesis MBL fold metallo-hydrolase GntH [unclassified Ruegeria]NOD35085.1 MBL fold metallo-hydrolase [Ruegeria sp. HKCCD7296]NOE42367.1 MBL fold metallo-hydrolase [Ruegeria sp. HKCCD7319]